MPLSWSWKTLTEINKRPESPRYNLLGNTSSGLIHRSCGPEGQDCISNWILKFAMCKTFPCGMGFEGIKERSWGLVSWKARRGHWHRYNPSCSEVPRIERVLGENWGLAIGKIKVLVVVVIPGYWRCQENFMTSKDNSTYVVGLAWDYQTSYVCCK